MTYPTEFIEWDNVRPASTDTRVTALKGMRRNDIFIAMNTAFMGSNKRINSPYTITKGWRTQVFYNLNGFSHTYTDADSEKEHDRIIMRNGNIRFAWNFVWTYQVQVKLLRTNWYFGFNPNIGYEYLGRMVYSYTAGALTAISWDVSADTSPPPEYI